MAIKVASTTVIDDLRQLENINNLTVNGNSFVDATSDSSIISVSADTNNLITLNAGLGNHFATSVFSSSDFGIIYAQPYTISITSIIDNFVDISLPTYLKSGDLVRVVVSTDATSTNAVSLNSGYTRTIVREYTASSHCSYFFIKTMGATPDTSIRITNNISASSLRLSVLVIITRLEVTNYNVSSSTGNPTSGAITLTPLAVTNAVAGVVFVHGCTNTNASTTTTSAPAGFTLIGKANQTGATAIAGFLRITSTQTVTPGAFLGTYGTGVWSAYTESRQVLTGTGNPTIAFLNVPTIYSCTLELDYFGGTIQWPTTVRWDTGAAPTFQQRTKNLILLRTYNGGTTWYASATQGYTL